MTCSHILTGIAFTFTRQLGKCLASHLKGKSASGKAELAIAPGCGGTDIGEISVVCCCLSPTKHFLKYKSTNQLHDRSIWQASGIENHSWMLIHHPHCSLSMHCSLFAVTHQPHHSLPTSLLFSCVLDASSRHFTPHCQCHFPPTSSSTSFHFPIAATNATRHCVFSAGDHLTLSSILVRPDARLFT